MRKKKIIKALDDLRMEILFARKDISTLKQVITNNITENEIRKLLGLPPLEVDVEREKPLRNKATEVNNGTD